MNQNRSGIFAQKLTTVGSEYSAAGQNFELKSQHRNFKVAVEGGNVEFSLNGANGSVVDGLVKPADGVVTFEGMQAFSKVAVRQASGTISLLRIWAY